MSLSAIPLDSSPPGPWCPQCLSVLEGEGTCSKCGVIGELDPALHNLVRIGEPKATFSQSLDAYLASDVIPRLREAPAPTCTEALMESISVTKRAEPGNPLWEGRGDIPRLVGAPGGIALDLGCGFGTIATALARSADHVFALDKSPVRAAVTAARLAAEGQSNATVLCCDGVELPLGTSTCDLVTLVGVLEWTGVGRPHPDRTQEAVLGECVRVLKPNGVLLIGIENRFGAHYFLGAREEHTDLRFISLMPRWMARYYHRARRRSTYSSYTYSKNRLRSMLRNVGMECTFMYPLPSYSQPQLTLPENPTKDDVSFYFDHVYQPTSTRRRIAARVSRTIPAELLKTFAPCFWVLGSRLSLDPGHEVVVTGTPYCHGTVKLVDTRNGVVTSVARLDGKQSTTPLEKGANARRWVASPLRRSQRLDRERELLRLLAGLDHASQPGLACAPRWREEAMSGIRAVERLSASAAHWCRTCVDSAPEPSARHEHGDLSLNNIIVGDGRLTLIDLPSEGMLAAPRGRDELVALLDLACTSGGMKHCDMEVGLDLLPGLVERASSEVAGLLSFAYLCGDCSPSQWLVIGALRDAALRSSPRLGARQFLEKASRGDLERALSGIAKRGAS